MRQADTNVVSIKFDKLIAPSSMHAGDPQVCESCSAILSKISKITTEGEEKVLIYIVKPVLRGHPREGQKVAA